MAKKTSKKAAMLAAAKIEEAEKELATEMRRIKDKAARACRAATAGVTAKTILDHETSAAALERLKKKDLG